MKAEGVAIETRAQRSRRENSTQYFAARWSLRGQRCDGEESVYQFPVCFSLFSGMKVLLYVHRQRWSSGERYSRVTNTTTICIQKRDGFLGDFFPPFFSSPNIASSSCLRLANTDAHAKQRKRDAISLKCNFLQSIDRHINDVNLNELHIHVVAKFSNLKRGGAEEDDHSTKQGPGDRSSFIARLPHKFS